MKNKILTLLVGSALIFSLSGCDNAQNTTASSEIKSTQGEQKEEKKEVKPEVKVEEKKVKEEKTIKVYFSDNQAMNLVEKEIKVTLDEGESLEEVAIEKLKEDSKDPELFNAISEDIKINSVTVENKMATVDISSENLSGGSTNETFLIDSIVSSLTSLDNIEKVLFLVDGKKVDTLMGQMEVTEPFTKDDVMTNIIKAQ